MIPSSKRTLAPKGSRQVPGTAKKATGQITKISAISKSGQILPYMLIFQGKTKNSTPVSVKPAFGSFYTATANHFANSNVIEEYVTKIIIPYVNSNRDKRKSTQERTENDGGWAILIWDNFSAHKGESVERLLREHRIEPFFLPPRCTSKYQPLDVLFNGYEKRRLSAHFDEWHVQYIEQIADGGPPIPTRTDSKRKLIATLVRGVHEEMIQRPQLVLNSWTKSQLFPEPEMDIDIILTDNDTLNAEVVRAMLDVTLNIGQMASSFQNDNPSEESSIDDDSASSAEIDTEYENEEDFKTLELDLLDDDDDGQVDDEISEEDVLPPPKRRKSVDDVSSLNSTTSMESIQQVSLSRNKQGGHIQVKWLTQHKIKAQELVQLMKDKGMIKNHVNVIGVLDENTKGFKMVLAGEAHGLITNQHPIVSWSAQC